MLSLDFQLVNHRIKKVRLYYVVPSRIDNISKQTVYFFN